jgi:F1F0 ATPase subunit 2
VQWTYLILSVAAGYVVGVLFYGGLKWTVDHLPGHPHKALLMLASFLLRFGVVIGVLLLLGIGHWQRMVAVVIGMLVARVTLVTRLGRQPRQEEVTR